MLHCAFDKRAGQPSSALAVGHIHTSQPVLILGKTGHLTALELRGADHLPIVDCRQQMRESLRVLGLAQPQTLIFQSEACILSPLRVIPLRQLLALRRRWRQHPELHG
ncbi:hypothetical protein D3C75_983940 [compost metagenome]